MTRIGIISDVHANVHALRAVLAELERTGVERFLCAGDIVGYGPHPNECVDLLRELPLVAVAGNHDLVALGRADLSRCGRLARQTLEWTMGQLTEASRQYLGELPLVHDEGNAVMTHGSLADPFEYVRSPDSASRQLQGLATEHPRARLLLLGHTHVAMAYGSDGGMLDLGGGRVPLAAGQRYVLNPGSVGQSRDHSPDAGCMVLDLDVGEASYMRVAYDIEACRADLRRIGLPTEACHRRPVSTSLHHRIGRRARRLLQRRGHDAAPPPRSR